MRYLDLGPLVLETDGGERRGVGGRRPAALLTMLLMRANSRVSIGDLIDAVWLDETGNSVGGTLETHVWRLRRLIEPNRTRGTPFSVLLNDSGGYRLVVDPDQVDSLRFERAALDVLDLLATRQPRRALRRADDALASWRGRPFDLLADAHWASGPIARLEEMRAQLEERRVDALLADDNPTRALTELSALLHATPFRERLWAQRMLALHRSGRTPEALESFHDARRVLQVEIGIDPGDELTDLQRRILAGDPDLQLDRTTSRATSAVAGTTVGSVHLPRPRVLIGRERDLDAVGELLDRSSLVTVVGPAGCGKTRLAIEVARAAAGRFPDGVWFVDLAQVSDPAQVPTAVATALGRATSTSGPVTDTLTTYAASSRALIVLDNCEHLLDAAADLADILTQPGLELALLATSREALDLVREEAYRLRPLPVAGGDTDVPRDPDGAIEATPAAELFIQRMSRDRRPAATPPALIEVEQICRRLDGLPLAIELAAGLTETYTLIEVADRVAANPTQLASVGRGHDEHHRTLFDAIDSSYRLLSPEEQHLHRRLSVLKGPFTPATAAAVAESLPSWRVDGLLARLAHRSMLTAVDQTRPGGPTRFSQLVTVRGHGATLLRDAGEVAATQHRATQRAVDLIRSRPRLGRPEEADWLYAVEDDLTTVRATLTRGLQDDAATAPAAEVARETLNYWFYRGIGLEGLRWLEPLTDRPELSSLDRAVGQLDLAGLLVQRGEIDRARSLTVDAMPEFEKSTIEHTAKTAEHLLNTAACFGWAHDTTMMHRLLAAAETIMTRFGSADLAAIHAAVLCMADAMSAAVDQVLARARRAYAFAQDVGNLYAGWLACSSGNAVALRTENPELGLWWSRRLLDQQRALGARAPVAQLETFGIFLAMAGRFEPAIYVWSAIHHQSRHTGSRWPRFPITVESVQRARDRLGDSGFQHAWRTGPTLSFPELVALT